MSKINNRQFGNKAEDEAVLFLESKGYEILERNFRTRLGEIDIIAKDKNTVCFIEVKARRTSDQGPPEEAVTSRKQHQITKVALQYIKEHQLYESRMRFDVVTIDKTFEVGEPIKLIVNAFDAAG